MKVIGAVSIKRFGASLLALFSLVASVQAANEPGAFATCTTSKALLRMQRQMQDEINLARTAPQRYATMIEAYFSTLDDRNIYVQGGEQIVMQEGRVAVDEALAFLRSAQALPALALNRCLSQAAQDHVNQSGARGLLGHVGADGSQPSDRATRRLGRQAYCGENISYGRNSAREHVIALLVDDGVAGRGHRLNLFNPRYHSLGVAVGAHRDLEEMAVYLMCTDEFTNELE